MAHFCSQCGKPISEDAHFCTGCGASITGKAPATLGWQGKRDKVLGKHRQGRTDRTRLYFWIAGIALVGGWVYSNLPESGHPVITASPVVTNPVSYGPTTLQMTSIPVTLEDGKITFSLDLLKEKKFVRFLYGDLPSGLPLLAYISTEGKIVTAVSVCEPCNSTEFHITGDKVVCNSCGSTWELNDLQAVSGSCGKYPPDAVPNTIVGNHIQIDEQIVARWQRRI